LHSILLARLHSWGKPWLRDNGCVLAIALMSMLSESGLVCLGMLTLFSTANSCLLLKTAYVCLLLQSNAEYSSALYRCRVPAGAVDTILSYCHNNLADQTLLDLLPYLHEKGVGVISASFSSMGLLRKEVRHSHICQSAFLGSPVTVFYSPVTAVTPCPRAAAKHHLSQVL